MKIFILANCQHVGLSACVRALVPGAHVESIDLGSLAAGPDYSEAALYDRARSADLVIMQPVDQARFGRLTSASLTASLRNVHLVPAIAIDAYHPDCIYIDGGGQHLKGPMGDYHSLIVAAAFLAGYHRERVPLLFNAYTFATLGFFGRMSSSINFIEQSARDVNLDLGDAIGEWQRPGPFMYTVNHPAIRVMFSLARQILTRANISQVDISSDNVEDDLALSTRWPVYPEIARRLGCPDEPFVFKYGSKGSSKPMSLSEFVDRSYEKYLSSRERLEADERIVSTSEILLRNSSRRLPQNRESMDHGILMALYKGIRQKPDPAGVQYWTQMTSERGIETTVEAFVGTVLDRKSRQD